jgi:hypothetical protein
VPSTTQGITAPGPSWGDDFQLGWLTAAPGSIAGEFRYADPFDVV